MYVLKKAEQKKLIDRLILTETLDGGWTKIFIDPATTAEWILFHHHGEMQGGGLPVMRENPAPSELADWMSKCISSGNKDDIVGIAWELSKEYDRWPTILDWLESNSAILTTAKVRLFLDNLEVLHVLNRRPVVGKDAREIDADYRFFQILAQRGKKLIGAG